MPAPGILREIPFFADLQEQDREALGRLLVRRRYPRGQIIFHRGDEGSNLYIIQKGRVKIVLPSPRGDEALGIQIVALYR